MVWILTGTGATTIPLNFEANIKYLKDYFSDHPELKAKYAHYGQYVSHTKQKFYLEPGTRWDMSTDPFGPVEEHEWPTVYKTDLANKRFGTLKSLLDMGGGPKDWWLTRQCGISSNCLIPVSTSSALCGSPPSMTKTFRGNISL